MTLPGRQYYFRVERTYRKRRYKVRLAMETEAQKTGMASEVDVKVSNSIWPAAQTDAV
jgi:hypothetical protein